MGIYEHKIVGLNEKYAAVITTVASHEALCSGV